MRHGGHFWYDGHHGYVECVGRERWKSYLNGEGFDKGSHLGHMKENLLDEMKYRIEREPDFYQVCHGVPRFLDAHVPGRNNENDWVLMDSIREEVILNDWGLCLEVMYALEDADMIEITKAYDTPNNQFLLRATVEDIPQPEELSESVTKLHTPNE